MEFLNQLGFWAFLALVPFILIYLIKPKPREHKIPSLMFFIKETGANRRKSFLRHLLHNLLFLLQLLAIAALAFSLTQPITQINVDSTSKNTVVVLDISASMQTQEGLQTRFDKALNFAKNSLKGTTSLVLVESKPLLILEEKSSTKAISMISGIQAKATLTNLGDAILLAKDILGDKDGRVLVISDFISTEGPDPQVAKRLIESAGGVVDFIDVSDKGSNVGFVRSEIDRFKTKAWVKNFDNEEKTLDFELFEEGKSIQKFKRTLLADSIETIEFDTPHGGSKLEVIQDDDLKLDDVLFISGPMEKKVKMLLITNNKNNFLINALTASNYVDLEISEPPVYPDFDDYDIIVMQNVEKDLITKVEMKKIAQSVEKGRSFIIAAQDDLAGFDMQGMDLIDIEQKIEATSPVGKLIDNQITKDIDFGLVEKYLVSMPVDNNTLVLACASDDSPILAIRDKGSGKIVYYGIFDEKSDLKHSPSYPIFWNQLIGYLMGSSELGNFNLKTGQVMTFGEDKNVKTPSGSLTTSRLLFDEVGFYEIDGNTYAVNLLDDKESDISKEVKIERVKLDDANLKPIKKREDLEIEVFLILLVFILFLIELFYMKYIGEI